jgi:glycosyltransferase involved in cell wall biosynthesis
LHWLKLLGVRTVTTVHDVLPFDLGTDFASARGGIYHRLYTCSSGLVVHSKHTRNCLAELDSRLLGKVALIPQGNYSSVEQHRWVSRKEAKTKIGVEPCAPVILIFGTIKPNKRLDLVIEALPGISKMYPQAKLVIAGKVQDQDISKYVDLANRRGVASSVLWQLDYITDEELEWYFSAADVIVFPYQWIYQSAALMMAMSFGKPVVATAVGSNSELIKDNKTGILVPLDDVDAMVNAIQTVLEQKARASAMGKAAHEYVTTELSWNNIARSMLAFYRQE